VVWSFETGPRKSLDLSATFGNSLADQRIMNWSAVRGSLATDFDQNARAIQGGDGFASTVPNRDQILYNHGLVTGVSDALDAMHEWIATIRPLNMPKRNPAAITRGNRIFAANCASCHGGVKWTKSRAGDGLYDDDPAYPENPIGANFFRPVEPVDPDVIDAVPQIRGIQGGNSPCAELFFMNDVGTFALRAPFRPVNPIEQRGGAAIAGQSTAGFIALPANTPEVGFNSPSLLNVGYHAPFLHNGSAPNLDAVFNSHRLPEAGNRTIRQVLNAAQRTDLRALMNSIDGDTDTFLSDTDRCLR